MSKPEKHTRRDFLQGRAAVRAAANQAQTLVDSAARLLGTDRQAQPVAHVHASRRAMACEFSVQYHQTDEEMSEVVLAALDLIETIEDQLTIYRDESLVLDINRQAASTPVEVDRELFCLLQLCQQLNQETGGAFDITSGPLSRVWGFLERAGRLPSETELASALARVGSEQVLLEQAAQTIAFSQPSVEINFNSIGKGYALDKAAALLQTAGHDDYLWQGGGSSLFASGANRASRQRCWTVGLPHPVDPQKRLAEFHLRDQALATAGGATQFFQHEDRRFSHLLDPRTGWPAEGVLTASVLAPTASLADGLATAFFVMGSEATEAYCHVHPEIAALLVCPAAGPPGYKISPFNLKKEQWTLL